jgi:RNA polymerase sigma-70 factor (ECF subfamily)
MSDHVDPATLGQLALPHLDALYRTARRLTRAEADAQDLLQQTYLEGCRSAGTLADPGRMRAWLFRILRNLWADERRRPAALELVESELPPEVVGNLEDEVLRAGFDDEVVAALASLPAEFRWAVVLVDVEGMSYEEAGQIMECPKGTVRSRLARAREALLARLHRARPAASRQGGRT